MPASSYSTQTRRHTRLLLARPGRAVWEYEDDVHLLKGFAEVANGYESLKRRQLVPRTPPTPDLVRLSDDSQSEPAGWIVDYDLPNPSPVATLHFMPRDDLCHIVNTGATRSEPKTPEEMDAAHAEALAYVIAYTIFRRSIARAHAQDTVVNHTLNPQLKRRLGRVQAGAALAAEFARTFESPDVQLVLANRNAAGPFVWAADAPELACGIHWLLDQLRERQRASMMHQADVRGCAFLASLNVDPKEAGVEGSRRGTDEVGVHVVPPYSYELLHTLLCDALFLVKKIPDIPSPSNHDDPLCKTARNIATRPSKCCIQ